MSPFLKATVFCALLSLCPALHAENAVVGTGTPASCTESSFDAALALVVNDTQGGTLTFNCGPDPDVILLSSVKNLSGVVVIDGGGKMTLDGQDVTRLFNINPRPNPEDVTVVQLRNLILNRGNAGAEPFGGAVLANAGTNLVLDNVSISNSLASTSGGAIATLAGVSLSIANSRFSGNLAANGGAIATRAVLSVNDSTFVNNNAPTGEGGAIQSYEGAAVLTRNAFIGNSARTGGALFKLDAGVRIEDSTFSGNTSGQNGGAIFLMPNVLTEIYDSTFSGNAANDGGGGVFTRGLTGILRSTFEGNVADVGGAIRMFGGDMAIERVTMNDNTAQTEGGGLAALTASSLIGVNPTVDYVTTSNNTVATGVGGDFALSTNGAVPARIRNSTLMGASASSGGSSIHLVGNLRLDTESSLIWARAGTPCGTASGASINSLGNNLGPLGCSLNAPSDAIAGTFGGFGLGEFANYGGRLNVFLPLPGSAVVDRAGNACFSFDVREKPAPVDGDNNGSVLCDAGSVERQRVEVPGSLFRDGFESL
jgi:predicted outer membrane repeat protein